MIAWQPGLLVSEVPICATRAVSCSATSACSRSSRRARRCACARRARCTGSGSSAGSASTRCAPAGCPSAPHRRTHLRPDRPQARPQRFQPRALLHQVVPLVRHQPHAPLPGSRCSARAAANASCPSLLSRRPLRRRSRPSPSTSCTGSPACCSRRFARPARPAPPAAHRCNRACPAPAPSARPAGAPRHPPAPPSASPHDYPRPRSIEVHHTLLRGTSRRRGGRSHPRRQRGDASARPAFRQTE